MKPFTREELQEISSKADDAICDGMNPRWVRALENLCTAADHLDAMIARSTIHIATDMEGNIVYDNIPG